MADMYKSEDFSLFLHQILLQSGSGSGYPGLDPIPAGEYFPVNTANEVDEHECESEDGGFEALAAEEPVRTAPSRISSKRSRAAEVHNLSEKRRRSRINEKMKALQNLIPNSNKTDKASMLDEAIEYLKQLQLQVQILTMRNGLSLYPMCLPGVSDPTQLSPMNMGFLEANRPINIDLLGLPYVVQETSTNVPIENTGLTHLPGPDISTVIQSGTSLGLGSSVEGPTIPTPVHISSMVADIFREDVSPHRQLDTDHRQSNLLVGNSSTAPVICETTLSRIKDNAFEAPGLGSRSPDNELLRNLQNGKAIASHFHR